MPLTDLLKKDNLVWTITATETFEQLKRAGTTTPVLAMPDFTKVFVVECDACGSGIRVVLMQEGKLIVFINKALFEKKS